MIGKAIYGKLSATTAVTAITSTRIYPDMATQDATYPFIVYSVADTAPTDIKDGVSPLDIVSVGLMIYADSYAVAIDLAEKVRTALDRMSGTYDGVNVQSCKFNGQSSGSMHLDKHIFIVEQEYQFRQNR
jgi:hypothetical protein